MEKENILCFNPDAHPHDTLKSFKEFCVKFELRYDAQFTDPPKSAMDAAIQRWVIQNTTETVTDPKPDVNTYDTLRENWRSRDRVCKILGMFSSSRLYSDWEAAERNEDTRKAASWQVFKTTMEQFYKPTENPTLNNYKFRSLVQETSESFSAYCNRVEREAKVCSFKCRHGDCTAETTSIRDQIVIGTSNTKIREEALLNSWDLQTLRTEGMKLESASRGEVEISGGTINRIGRYSYNNMKRSPSNTSVRVKTEIECYNCGESFKGPAFKHNQVCPAKKNKCRVCNKFGHYQKFCKGQRDLKFTEREGAEEELDRVQLCTNDDTYNINIFQVEATKKPEYKRQISKGNVQEFKVQVVTNGSLATVTADTGARVSVCGKEEARKWNLLQKMTPTAVRIKPYNSESIPVLGKARCAVTFGETSIPVEWYILQGKCEPILSGSAAVQLGIVNFTKVPPVYQPIHMINSDSNSALSKSDQQHIQNILARNPEVFSEKLGKHRNYQVKFHIDPTVKPVVSPARPTPYHLTERIGKVINELIENDVLEEHPVGEPAPWVSNAHIVPKADGGLRVTLDAKKVNKAIQSSNLPIPRQEDIKTKLGGNTIFSRMDFKWSFFQLSLHKDSRYLTVFSLNGKLYRYKRLTMGMKPAQGELNAALMPLFRHIPDAHLIHDDLIVASKDNKSHIKATEDVIEAVKDAGLTLNPEKCEFGKKQIKFWGMIISAEGVQPDPEKVDVLEGLEPPKNKDELTSFLCMMQSNADFITAFAQIAAPLRELTKKQVRFQWKPKHQKCFEELLAAFRKDVLLRYFDVSKQTFLFTDAHITGLGAILAQGSSIETAKPVAIASRTTTDSERKYPQIDLEGLGVDYALSRFRNYIIGSPKEVIVVTDHMPLCSVFNGSRTGSVRTERYKLKNQDLRFKVVYQRGKQNQTDYISRRASPLQTRSKEEQQEAESINNLLYMLHTTPIVDRITLKAIAEETSNDETLNKLQMIVQEGKTWIPKDADESLKKFKPILPEITITGNGILLKGDRIILPEKLQKQAIQLAHQGSHPRQSAMERRLRFHFYFDEMNMKVARYLSECTDCPLFSDKKCKEPLQSHTVPGKSWENTSVDLYGPMPSRHHIVVVQDMASRYPAAKLVTSTAADKVIPVLSDIYDTYGNPSRQLSDNGPPFNSAKMQQFADKRNIQLDKIPPGHPSGNPVETFMKPLGKTMKIAHYNHEDEKKALQNLLENYRDTPHPATGVPPAAMLFRDSISNTFPRKSVADDVIHAARANDATQKLEYQEKANSSKYKKPADVSVGDYILVRNFQKSSKFQPTFLPEPFVVTSIKDHGRKLEVERLSDGRNFYRHPDDVKITNIPYDAVSEKKVTVEPQWEKHWDILNEASQQDTDHINWWSYSAQPNNAGRLPQDADAAPDAAVGGEERVDAPAINQRPRRLLQQPDRLGAVVYNTAHPLRGEDLVTAPWWPNYPRQ